MTGSPAAEVRDADGDLSDRSGGRRDTSEGGTRVRGSGASEDDDAGPEQIPDLLKLIDDRHQDEEIDDCEGKDDPE